MMKQKLFTLFVALVATTALWANNVLTTIDGFQYIVNLDNYTAKLMKCVDAEKCKGSLIIPSTIYGGGHTATVVEISSEAFKYKTELTSVTIPNTVTTIGSSAFYYCHGLTSITIGNAVTIIGSQAFYDCRGLTSITIPNSVTTIESSAFEGCNGLTSVTIGNSVTTIGSSAFKGCGLSSITIPNSVTTIGDYAFLRNNGLKAVIIGNSVTTIGIEAFYSCGELVTVTIPNTIASIGSLAFQYCSKIEKVYIKYNPFGIDYTNRIISAFYASTPTFEKVYDYTIIIHDATPTNVYVYVDLSKFETFQYAQMALDFAGVKHELSANENSFILTGLTPASTNKATFYSQLIGESEWREGATIEVTTPELTLTTLNPKVVSAGTAVVAAETNISDYETNVGFEWRKTDAPSTLPSKSGAAVVCNGMMEGRLLNLGTNAYWNVRPYYTAADGTSYYGEWITFDPSDFSYFEPTVHTYALATSPTSNSVQVRGYVMTGTDEVTEQGFEYWINSAKAPNRVSSATSEDVHRVKASGQLMTAVLENLAYSSTYTCRAYALAGGKTYYGEEVQFLTPENPTGLFDVLMNNDAQQATKFMHNGQLFILRDGNLFTATGARVK